MFDVSYKMDAIKSFANKVYDDLSPLAASLTKVANDLVSNEFAQSNDHCGVQFVSKLVKTGQGQDLLARYRMALFQTKETNNEIARIGNLCSTRMSAVQQTMNEEYEAVNALDNLLNQIPKINSQLEEMTDQLGELHRHTLQIEISLAALNATGKADGSKTNVVD